MAVHEGTELWRGQYQNGGEVLLARQGQDDEEHRQQEVHLYHEIIKVATYHVAGTNTEQCYLWTRQRAG